MRSLVFLTIALLVAFASVNAQAAVPSITSFQGRVVQDGIPLVGDYSVDVAIFDAVSGGTALWNESHPNVAFDGGVFSLQIGSVVPLTTTLFETSSTLYLEVKVDGTAFSSRTPFTSVPFAQVAAFADSARTTAHADTATYALTTGGSSGEALWAVVGDDIHNLNSGNVGVGTATPAAKLDVTGLVRAQAETPGNPAFQALNTFGNRVVHIGNHQNDNGMIQVFTSNGTTESIRITADPGRDMWLNNGGNVGIGTTAPYTRLMVDGGSGTTALVHSSSGTAQFALASGESGTGRQFNIASVGTGDLQFQDTSAGGTVPFSIHGGAPSSVLTISSSGNVGIGTTTPGEKLEVTGVVHSTTGGFKFPDGSLQTTAASGGGGDSDWTINGNDIYHQPGNVGIGVTASDSSRLHIEATANHGLVVMSADEIDNKTGALIVSTAVTGNVFGVKGVTASNGRSVTDSPGHSSGSAAAVYGLSSRTGPVGDVFGVLGQINGAGGDGPGPNLAAGVYGVSYAATGLSVGVYGDSQSSDPSGAGVVGKNKSPIGNTRGVWGEIDSPTGRAIYGNGGANGGFAGYFNGKVKVDSGDLSITTIGDGLVLKSPNGTCYRLRVNDDGSLFTEAANCP